MAYELVYTSAPEGLNRGSSGFCVVACTKGLGPRLVVTLEGLSAYKPLYPHYAPNAWDNPVSRSHYLYEANGEQQHILSRICFNGVDHTGRSNKLASHLVLSEREAAIAQGGPSSLLLREELFKDAAWTIKAEYFSKQKEIPPTTVQVRKCTLWGSVMGDPGWAGFLAQTYIDTPNKNVYLAYDPAQHKDILPLLDEAMSLLPDDLRWKVTFNTYFVNLPAGMSCTWRCCPVDSDALRAARRSPMNVVIDITKPQALNREGELITCARTGVLAKPEKRIKARAETVARAIGQDEEALMEQTVYLEAPEVKNGSSQVSEQYFVPNYPAEEENSRSTVSAWIRLILTLLAIVALLAAIIGGALYFVSVTNEKQTLMKDYEMLKADYAKAAKSMGKIKRMASTAKTVTEIDAAIKEIENHQNTLDNITTVAEQLKPHQKYFEESENKPQEEIDLKPVENMKESTPDGIVKKCKKMKTELGNVKKALEEKRKEIHRPEAGEKTAGQSGNTPPSLPFDPGRTMPPQQPAEKKQNKNSRPEQKLSADDARYLWRKSGALHTLQQDQQIDVQLGVRDPGKIAIFLLPTMKKQQIGSTFRCEPDQNDRQAEIETKFDRAKGILSFTLKNQFSPSPQTEISIELGNGKVLPLYFKLGISKIQPVIAHRDNVKIEIDAKIKVSIKGSSILLPDPDFRQIYAQDNSRCRPELFALYLNCPGFKKIKLEKRGDGYGFVEGDSVLRRHHSRLEALKHIEEEFRKGPMRFAKMVPDRLKKECEQYAKSSRGKKGKKQDDDLQKHVDNIITKLKTEIPLKDLGYETYTGTWEKANADTVNKLADRKREIENAIQKSTVLLVYDKQEYEQFDLKDIL